jgi:predicted amidohydrolase
MQITTVQFDIAWEDPAVNADKVRKLLHDKPLERNGLIVLPEMFASGYSMDVAKVAEETTSGAGTACLEAIARESGVTVVGGVVRQDASGCGHNDALVVGPDGAHVAHYSKMHPMTLGGESQHYTRGAAVVSFDWGGLKVSPFICYDLRFPEVFREASLNHGAEVLLVIASFPTVRHEHWRPLLIARAIENQAYVVGVNRCGSDPNLDYSGGSVIVDPMGQVVAEAGADECVLQVDIDPKAPDRFRQKLPALKDAWYGR